MTSVNNKNYRLAKTTVVLMEHHARIGHLCLGGKDHVDLLHRITTNELRNLVAGQAQINVFANEVGRIVDRVHLLKKDNRIHLISSTGDGEKLATWIDRFIFLEDVTVEQPQSGILSVFGPRSPQLLQQALRGIEIPGPGGFSEIAFERESLLVASAPELTIPGFNLIVPLNLLATLRTALSAAADANLDFISDETYEVLRIEGGWPLFGKDFDETVNPHEAGMLPYINFDKGCYVGQEVIARLDTYEKVQKRLVGIEIEGADLPEPGDTLEVLGEKCGHVTSAAPSIDFGNIALGYVRSKFLKSKELKIITRNQEIKGALCSLPFVKRADGTT